MDPLPQLHEITEARRQLADWVRETPVWEWTWSGRGSSLAAGTRVLLKLELFQHTGTFKPRGALMNMLALDREALGRGVTGVSAGNHAVAVSYAARALGTTAAVVMPRTANPARVAYCRELGARVELVENGAEGFLRVEAISRAEGRTAIHPFEGRMTLLGTGTVGLELAAQAPDLDAVIIPIGGGGLCGGAAAAIKQALPHCRVYGVEPEGADTMHRSFAAGAPRSIERVDTIADSLGAPFAAPYSFAACQTYVDELVLVDDDQIRVAMARLFRDAKLAVEPAGAAATAALFGPLREALAGQRVGVLVCGSNTDLDTFAAQAGEGFARLAREESPTDPRRSGDARS